MNLFLDSVLIFCTVHLHCVMYRFGYIMRWSSVVCQALIILYGDIYVYNAPHRKDVNSSIRLFILDCLNCTGIFCWDLVIMWSLLLSYTFISINSLWIKIWYCCIKSLLFKNKNMARIIGAWYKPFKL